MHLDVKVLGADGRKVIETEALLDSGVGGVFMSHEFAEENGLRLCPLERIIKVRNVDGTPNKKGEISQYARGPLTINGQTFLTTFLITGLGGELIILGLPWLRKINPAINWRTGTFQFMVEDESHPELSHGKGRTLIGRVQTEKPNEGCLSWRQKGTEKKENPFDMTKEE
ncbi:hypothetical protein L208DRAFT_1534893 [Tricholoma matsutake]|nr:hypothetical protein L208DRAFT_1534893 [Tricholoma matsutake 945]